MREAGPGDPEIAGPLTVACALSGKKISRYLTEEFLERARRAGLSILLVDMEKPLEDQGPFDVLLHKIFSKSWERRVEDYARSHPEVLVLDSPDAIRSLSDRETMLQGLESGEVVISNPDAGRDGDAPGAVQRIRVRVPAQMVVHPADFPTQVAELVRKRGMQYPLLLKPAGAHGTGIECHTIAVVNAEAGLEELARLDSSRGTPLDLGAPVVAQEYIYHQGVMFKIYVVGGQAVFACRPSLGERDLAPEPDDTTTHVKFFQGISRKPPAEGASPRSDADEYSQLEAVGAGARARQEGSCALVSQLSRDGCSTPELLDMADAPPDWFVVGLGREMQRRLGLSLFNIDVIMSEEPGPAGERTAFVVDINYFPGYDKLEGWQEMLLDFLLESARQGRKRREAARAMSSFHGGPAIRPESNGEVALQHASDA